FAEAWLAGAAGVLVQGLVALLLWRAGRAVLHRPLPELLVLLLAYTASAVVVGSWSAIYLRARLGRGEALLGPPRAPGGYALGALLGLCSAGLGLCYQLLLRRYFPHWLESAT